MGERKEGGEKIEARGVREKREARGDRRGGRERLPGGGQGR